MNTYEIVKNGEETLLVSRNASEYITTVIGRGTEIDTELDEQLINVTEFNGLSSYYWADENAETLQTLCENASEFTYFQDDEEPPRFLYRIEVNYFYFDLNKGEKTVLGSYFENGMFLSRMDTGEIKAYFFQDSQLLEKNYVSFQTYDLDIRYRGEALCCARQDGLYDILINVAVSNSPFDEDIEIYFHTEEYLRVKNGSECKMFYYDLEKQGYVLIFEGQNGLCFQNALLEEEPIAGTSLEEEKVISRLYFFDGTEKILLAESFEEVEYDDYKVTIAGKTWSYADGDYSLLNREPDEEEPEEESESESLDNDSWTGPSAVASETSEIEETREALHGASTSEEKTPETVQSQEKPRSVLRVGGENPKKKKSWLGRLLGK